MPGSSAVTLVDADTGEVVQCSADEARHLTERIKVLVEGAWDLIKQAYEERAWAALGYPSWDDYCSREFGTSRLRLPREERQEVVLSLRESGMSTRAIAAATGQSKSQVDRDLAGVPNGTPAPVLGTDGKQYQPTRPGPVDGLDDLFLSQPTGGNATQVTNNSGDTEWFTPVSYIEAARTVMGGIDLDPASCAAANAVVGASRFWTVDDDGLIQPWEGRVWMNPPYAAKLIRPFAERLAGTFQSGEVTEAVALVNSATETGWWQTIAGAATALCFPQRRIRFWHPDKDGDAGPLQGQTVFYLGPNVERFRSAFNEFGVTAEL